MDTFQENMMRLLRAGYSFNLQKRQDLDQIQIRIYEDTSGLKHTVRIDDNNPNVFEVNARQEAQRIADEEGA